MASPAQILANKANAALSTGPRTPEGRAVARFNGIRHGLTSSQVVLPNEDPAEWEAFKKEVVAGFAPATAYERSLAVSVAEHRWRMARLNRIERAVFEERMLAVADNDHKLLDGDAAAARLFTDPAEAKRLALLLRYMGQAERAFFKALAELNRIQALRLRHEKHRALMATHFPQRERHDEPIGSASHTPHSDPHPDTRALRL